MPSPSYSFCVVVRSCPLHVESGAAFCFWAGTALSLSPFEWWCFPPSTLWLFPISLPPSVTWCTTRCLTGSCHRVEIQFLSLVTRFSFRNWEPPPQKEGRRKQHPPKGGGGEGHHQQKRGGGESTTTQRRKRESTTTHKKKGSEAPPPVVSPPSSLKKETSLSHLNYLIQRMLPSSSF